MATVPAITPSASALDRLRQLHPALLQEDDIRFLDAVDVTAFQPEDSASVVHLARLLQSGLRRVLAERNAARSAQAQAEHLLAEANASPLRRAVTTNQPVQADALRARDQHILYLQYEIGQRDLQIQQRTEEIQQCRAEIDTVRDQRAIVLNELQLTKDQRSRVNADNEALRQSIDSQMKETENRLKTIAREDEISKNLDSIETLTNENHQLKLTSHELQNRLSEATNSINEAATEHLRLKKQVEGYEKVIAAYRQNTSQPELIISKPSSSAAIQTDATTDDEAQEQLDGLIAIVNERVDEWKELLRNRSKEDAADQSRLMSVEKDALSHLQNLLRRRNLEVDSLRNSLAVAVEEIDDAARIIAELKMRENQKEESKQRLLQNERQQDQSEIINMHRHLNSLEDELEKCNRENRELTLKIRRYELGTYGLPEAMSEINEAKKQLEAREKYTKDLIVRLNKLTSENDTLKSGMRSDTSGVISDGSAGENDKLAGPVHDRLAIEVFLKQIEQLEEERIHLKQTISALKHSSVGRDRHVKSGNYEETASDNENANQDLSDVHSLRHKINTLEEEFGNTREENRQLENSMREILSAVRGARIRGLAGERIELFIPSLEKLLTVMEVRSRAISVRRSERARVGLDSAVFSDADGSVQKSLRNTIEELLLIASNSIEVNADVTGSTSSKIQYFVGLCFRTILESVVEENGEDGTEMAKMYEQGASVVAREVWRLVTDYGSEMEQKLKSSEEALQSTQTDTSYMEKILDRLKSLESRIGILSDENTGLRERLRDTKERINTGSQLNEELTSLGSNHRQEVDLLVRINADLRTDIQRREANISDLRSALQTANERFAQKMEELPLRRASISQHAISQISAVVPEEEAELAADMKRMEQDHLRVVATLEAKILRLENELKIYEEERQKERQDLISVMEKTGRNAQLETGLREQITNLTGELNHREKRMQILSSQLEALDMELQNVRQDALQRENDLRRDKEKAELYYKSVVSNLQQGSQQIPSAPVPSDSSRTFVHAAPVPQMKQLANAEDAGGLDKFKIQIQEKDRELRNLAAAFQKFKDEMLNFPPPDKDLADNLMTQKREIQVMLDASRESNARLAAQLRKTKSEEEHLVAEVEGLRIEIRRRDGQIHHYEELNGQLTVRISDLEAAVEMLQTSGDFSADVITVPALKETIVQLEDALAQAMAAEQSSGVKPEVLRWQEKKKWEKIVEKLKDKVKETEDKLTSVDRNLAMTSEALTRTERERAAMDKKMVTLTKKVADLTQQPAFLQRALDESHKEGERLKSIIQKCEKENKRLEDQVSKLQKRETDHLSALEDLNAKHRKLALANQKMDAENGNLAHQLKEAGEKEEERLRDLTEKGNSTVPEPPLGDIMKNPAEILKAVDAMKSVINDQQVELKRLKSQNSTMKNKIKKFEEEKFTYQMNVAPVDAAEDTKRTLNSLVTENSKLQREIKKSKDAQDVIRGRINQTEVTKSILEQRVLELMEEKDEMLNRRHPEVKAIERLLESKMWDLTAEAEKWKFVALKANGGKISKEYQVQSYEKVIKDNIVYRSEMKRLQTAVALKDQELVKTRKRLAEVVPAESELYGLRRIHGSAEKRIAELEIQLSNIIDNSPRERCN